MAHIIPGPLKHIIKICQRKLYKVFFIKTRSSINSEIKERDQDD